MGGRITNKFSPVFISRAFLLSLLGCILLGTLGKAQVSQANIEFLAEANHVPGQGESFKDEQPKLSIFLRTAKNICVQGIWALFTTENFGRSNPGNTTVYPYHGASRRDCSGNIEDILKNIKSVRPLASNSQIETYVEKYFLSAETTGQPANSNARNRIKSLVIANGDGVTGKSYILCKGANKCICLQKENGPFIIPDLEQFPLSDPIGVPLSRLVVANSTVLMDECEKYSKPILRSG